MTSFKLSKQWRISEKDGELVLSGGQDTIFVLPLEQDPKQSFFTNLGYETQFTKSQLRKADMVLFEQLVSAGIVLPQLPKRAEKHLSVYILPENRVIAQLLPDKVLNVRQSPSDIDLLLLVRETKDLQSFLQGVDYMALRMPHLFVDLAYGHVISLGPLVFPNETPCVACLEGRLTDRWGNDQPPPVPRSASELARFAAEWLKVELHKLADDDYYLTHKTIVCDLEERSFRTNTILTVPVCPYCHNDTMTKNGKLGYNAAYA